MQGREGREHATASYPQDTTRYSSRDPEINTRLGRNVSPMEVKLLVLTATTTDNRTKPTLHDLVLWIRVLQYLSDLSFILSFRYEKFFSLLKFQINKYLKNSK